MGKVNYYERTHDIADVPHDFAPRFYATATEMTGRAASRPSIPAAGRPCSCGPILGSSCHKIYPWTQLVARWLAEKANATVFLTGDKNQGVQLQEGLFEALRRDGADVSRIIGVAGEWDIRDTLASPRLWIWRSVPKPAY